MLVYDLICSQGHQFEGWFNDLADLTDQLEQNLILCPVCGDENILRRPSTFGVVKSNRSANLPIQAMADKPPAAPQPSLNELATRLAELSTRFEKEYDDVGSRFSEEALKMHYGVTERRNIRGQSTEAQEETLRKEGVEYFKVPFLSRKGFTDKSS